MDALDEGGTPAAFDRELVPRLATRIVAPGTRNEVEIGATSRVLLLMALDGLLVRGRPTGTWTGRQYTWHRRDRFLGELPAAPEPDDAAAALVGAYRLEAFGPATFDDVRWWTGWTVGKTEATLAANPVDEVVLEGGETGLVSAGPRSPPPIPDRRPPASVARSHGDGLEGTGLVRG